MSGSNSSSNGVGFTGLLTLLFIGLKLGGAINWSWWWVLSPVWITAAFVVLCLMALVILHVIKEMKQ
tara:strand:- start:415 stop:615 length:201 start_codon:yes stop_codon:yes gene_type:complete